MIIVIIIIAILLRVYGQLQNFYFSGELGKELLYLRQIDINNMLPLSGMSTSHEWLSYGPFYYWIMFPFYKLFAGDPFILFWASVAVSITGLILNFYVIKRIINNKIAVISTLLMAVSPLLIWQTQLSKLHTFFFVLSPLLMYFMYKLWNKKRVYLIWTGLIFGLMFSFHFSQLPIFILILIMLYIKEYKFKDYLTLTLSAIIPNITILVNSIKILIWIPYRIIVFSATEIGGSIYSFTEFFGRSIFWSRDLWYLGFGVSIFVIFHYIYTKRSDYKNDFIAYYVGGTIVLTILSNLLHGAPPVHYFLPIFINLYIIFAIYLGKLKYWPIPVLIIILINFSSYFTFIKPDDYVPIQKQIEIAKTVVENQGNEEFSLKRIGPYDYFPENYSQNYKYLIYYYGGNLVSDSKRVVTIDEYNNFNIK